MRNVLAFTCFPESVSFDGASQDHGRAALMLHSGFESGVNLDRVMPADAQALQLVIGEVLDHLQ